MPIVYLVLGILVLTAGVLNLIAGIRTLKFRGRTFALVALFSNVVPMLTCYCAATGLAVMIYGLIVLFNSEVAQAFELAAKGMSPEDVRAHFSPRARYYQPLDPDRQ
jgi:hypothetical protein